MTSVEKLVGISAQHNEIIKRVANGTLDPTLVKRALQNIIEGQLPSLPWTPPTWWRDYGAQMALADHYFGRQLWPEPPTDFMPRLGTNEVPLLYVPRSFEVLWDTVEVPWGGHKYREDLVLSDKHHLRFTSRKRQYANPIWLAFDPEANRSMAPNQIWGSSALAGPEVLAALIQFPDLSRMWRNAGTFPLLSGYQLKYKGRWSYTPSIAYRRMSGLAVGIELCKHPADLGCIEGVSPTVGEC